MKELSAEIEIKAPRETVWRILVDFNRFPDWNPFIRKAQGELREGKRLKMHIEPPGGISMTLRPVVKKVTANREFCWLGHFIIPGLFDGDHSFKILSAPNGKIRFVQNETFKGLFVSPLWPWFKGPAKRGFEAMNRALKKRAEGFVDDTLKT